MIDYSLDEQNSILTVRPTGSLEKADFDQLAKTLDPYIEKTGGLKGMLIDAPAFPGWKSFGDLVGHLRFVRDHHKYVKKIAIVTDSGVGTLAENVGAHFIAAEVRRFHSIELDAAKEWILAP